jgi:hypothetical protein
VVSSKLFIAGTTTMTDPLLGTNTLGLLPLSSTEEQILVFDMLVTSLTQITTTTTGVDTIASPGAGAYIIFNSKIRFGTSSSVPNMYTLGGTLESSFAIEKTSYVDQVRGKYNRVRVASTSATSLKKMFVDTTRNSNSGLNDDIFGLAPFYIDTHASLYPDDGLMDFYIAFTDQLDSPFPQTLSFFHFNAYSITLPKPFNIRYSVVNWYGGSTVNNDAAYIPIFIRIEGFFTTQDKGDGDQRVFIFFDNLDFFRDDSNNFNYQSACVSSFGSYETSCRTFKNSLSPPNQNYINY